MNDKIQEELSRDFVWRMREWARKIDCTPVASSWPGDDPMGGIGRGSRYYETHIPPLLGRAHDTDMAIAELPARYAQAVRQYWRYEGRSLRWHGRQRQIDYHTFEIWVIKGHELLKGIFSVQSARWHADRQIKNMQASA